MFEARPKRRGCNRSGSGFRGLGPNQGSRGTWLTAFGKERNAGIFGKPVTIDEVLPFSTRDPNHGASHENSQWSFGPREPSQDPGDIDFRPETEKTEIEHR